MPLTTRRFMMAQSSASPPNSTQPSPNPSSVRFSLPNALSSSLSLSRLPPFVSRKRLRPTLAPTGSQAASTGVESDHADLLDNAVVVEPIGTTDGELDVPPNSSAANSTVVAQVDKPISSVSGDNSLSAAASVAATREKQKNELVSGNKAVCNSTLETLEFSFLDNKNVCCGICGEIVPYEQLMSDHLPKCHPDVFSSSNQEDNDDRNVEQQQQQRHLREKLFREKRFIETGFKMSAYRSAARAPKTTSGRGRAEPSRKVSSIRVNPRVMSLAELEQALKKKMYEKLNRRVPVTLMDKIHARCGMCNAIISLNKKFEIVHLVRHFNCWHPTVHSCAGSWQNRQPTRRGVKLLSVHDFAVVDTGSGFPDSLQCIWCGMFVESHCLAQHFGELHSDNVEVPKCNLCMHELVLTARYQEKFNIELQITLPDEHHMKCNECGASFSSEVGLDNHVQRRHVDGFSAVEDPQADEDDVNLEEIGPEAFANSRMTLGKRRRPKRRFIMPALRQAVPLDSEYVEPIAECHWKCKFCEGDIYGAVISAAAIRHYKFSHPEHVDNMQYEICKSRLEKISDGCMEFIHPRLIECLLCQHSFNLHQPFNMCRAIRHLKAKHPNLMPEYAGLSQFEDVDEEEEGPSSTAVFRRQPMATTLIASDTPAIVYAQQNLLAADLSGATTAERIVYATRVAQSSDDDGNDEEAEEIIAVAAEGGTIVFDPSSTYSQQFVAAGANTPVLPMTYQANSSELDTPMSFNSGIRVFRTPQQMRYDDHGSYHTYNDSSVAAKNARLDHGAIVRQLPPSVLEPHRHHSVQPPQSHLAVLDGQLVETPTAVAFHPRRQQSQPRRFYLLLQSNAVDSPAPVQHSLLDSSMVSGVLANDRSMDRQSVISVMDDSIMDAQRLTELMSQAHPGLASAAANDHGQPQLLMTGDEPLV